MLRQCIVLIAILCFIPSLQAEPVQPTAGITRQADTGYVHIVRDIHARVRKAWQAPPRLPKGRRIDVQVQTEPSGAITQVSIARSSGHAALDAAAVRAIWHLERFPAIATASPEIFAQRFKAFTIRMQ